MIGALVCACASGDPTAPAVTTGIAFHFCGSSTPIWMAYQDDAGAWTRSIPDASGIYHAAIGSRGGVAMVRGSANSGIFSIYLEYATAAELTTQYAACTRQSATGAKALQGTIAGLGASELAQVTMGGVASTASTSFNIAGVVDGPVDLIAARFPRSTTSSIFGPPTGVIIRRGLNLATGSTMPVLDFSAAEAFAPSQQTLTVANLGADQVSVEVNFLTATQTYAVLYADTAGTLATRPFFGIPTSSLTSGDVHDVDLVAGTSQSARFIEQFTHALADETLTLGPELAAPTITVASKSPNVRPHVVAPQQPEYNALAEIDFCEGAPCGTLLVDRTVTMVMTAGYAGNAATSWDMTVPDFTTVNGFNANWGLVSGAAMFWNADAAGGATLIDLTSPPVNGLTVRDAARVGTLPSTIVVQGGTVVRPRFLRGRSGGGPY